MNRSERRAVKFNHQPAGKIFTSKGASGKKTGGKIKKQGRANVPSSMDTSTAAWNLAETS